MLLMFENIRNLYGVLSALTHMLWIWGTDRIRAARQPAQQTPATDPNRNGDIFDSTELNSVPIQSFNGQRSRHVGTFLRASGRPSNLGNYSVESLEFFSRSPANNVVVVEDIIRDIDATDSVYAAAHASMVNESVARKNKKCCKKFLYKVVTRCMPTGSNFKPKISRFNLPKKRVFCHPTSVTPFEFFSRMGSRNEEPSSETSRISDVTNDAMHELLRTAMVQSMTSSRLIITADQAPSVGLGAEMRRLETRIEQIGRSMSAMDDRMGRMNDSRGGMNVSVADLARIVSASSENVERLRNSR